MIKSWRLPIQEVHTATIEKIQSRIDSDNSDDESETEEVVEVENDGSMLNMEYCISSGEVTLPESSV